MPPALQTAAARSLWGCIGPVVPVLLMPGVLMPVVLVPAVLHATILDVYATTRYAISLWSNAFRPAQHAREEHVAEVRKHREDGSGPVGAQISRREVRHVSDHGRFEDEISQTRFNEGNSNLRD